MLVLTRQPATRKDVDHEGHLQSHLFRKTRIYFESLQLR
ncbi:hypothetical protein CSC30_2182 [Pseudomonas aeruginosa]|nr:hypothetical protein CSC30_2182 [Pseudomonas aeruginosa]AWZ88791.1 hypothetical protein CSC41_0059 [Pseudomonas aeruginosa]